PSLWKTGQPPPVFPDRIFHTLRLFTANLPADKLLSDNTQGLLAVATAAIIATLLLVAQMIAALLTRSFIAGARRTRRNHIIICGLSRKAHHLALAYRSAQRQVVLIEKEINHPGVDALLLLGVQIEFGDATDPQVLRKAGLARACLLV